MRLFGFGGVGGFSGLGCRVEGSEFRRFFRVFRMQLLELAVRGLRCIKNQATSGFRRGPEPQGRVTAFAVRVVPGFG